MAESGGDERRAKGNMGKRTQAKCTDCYFRRAGLCALPGDNPCPTFRHATAGVLEPPRQPRLVPLPAAAPEFRGRVGFRHGRRRATSSTAAGSRGSGSASACSILIGGYLIAFVAGNDKEASVDFVFGQARTSLIWVILLSLLAGLVGGVLLSQLHRRRQARRSEASVETPSPISDGDA